MATKQVEGAKTGGTSILGLLGVLFVGLKLTGYIDWSWWYVTMPFWGGLALVLIIFIGFFVVYCGAAVLDHIITSRKRKR